MSAHYLDFERPIADLEAKIDELSKLSDTAGSGAFDNEIASLRQRAEAMRRDAYSKLDTWQKIQVARHPERPHCTHYIAGLIDDYVELRGDRRFGDDQAIVGGLGRFRGNPVVVIGNEKGHDTTTRIKHNFGLARPEGYRKAVRLMDLADQYNLPVISFGDTSGAYPGLGAEERGQGEAIARSTERCLTLGVPMVATIIGEGGSGGVLAIVSANRVLILEHAVLSVASPEAGASILFRDRGEAGRLATAWKMTAQDLLQQKIVDRIIEEPLGGAHANPEEAIRRTGDVIEEELGRLADLSPDALRKQRADRFYAIGRSGAA
ncbi:acetyl-CoA carboxylase carboxyltransferase subunit alpha [Phenylobacterium montanum]|uniref:Acetyl-coenzyme A carboxylase carboxyl transferase subunit alpha n=1 Tax=Phenylobacterium montanum TaxID=2823693 RepID=A0A975IVC8_9CAUL|nr:acetyl-CoA carboxylase carboxyltransferase subunit alpha [Caulobacter sp. S6]QUD87181.1 acetyl-CoA carboxylase carboxyltransferase subunit alpha [Caulobacter sp. S6]